MNVADLERQLAEGVWLSPGRVAVLLDVSRSTVHGLLAAGRIKYTRTTGGPHRRHRRCDPQDVGYLLAEKRRVRNDAPVGQVA
jgi:excisionase family DNA binding protein